MERYNAPPVFGKYFQNGRVPETAWKLAQQFRGNRQRLRLCRLVTGEVGAFRISYLERPFDDVEEIAHDSSTLHSAIAPRWCASKRDHADTHTGMRIASPVQRYVGETA